MAAAATDSAGASGRTGRMTSKSYHRSCGHNPGGRVSGGGCPVESARRARRKKNRQSRRTARLPRASAARTPPLCTRGAGGRRDAVAPSLHQSPLFTTVRGSRCVRMPLPSGDNLGGAEGVTHGRCRPPKIMCAARLLAPCAARSRRHAWPCASRARWRRTDRRPSHFARCVPTCSCRSNMPPPQSPASTALHKSNGNNHPRWCRRPTTSDQYV